MPLGERPKVDLVEAQLTDAHIIESRGGAIVDGDADAVKEWDPTPMMEELYQVSWLIFICRRESNSGVLTIIEHLTSAPHTTVPCCRWSTLRV